MFDKKLNERKKKSNTYFLFCKWKTQVNLLKREEDAIEDIQLLPSLNKISMIFTIESMLHVQRRPSYQTNQRLDQLKNNIMDILRISKQRGTPNLQLY